MSNANSASNGNKKGAKKKKASKSGGKHSASSYWQAPDRLLSDMISVKPVSEAAQHAGNARQRAQQSAPMSGKRNSLARDQHDASSGRNTASNGPSAAPYEPRRAARSKKKVPSRVKRSILEERKHNFLDARGHSEVHSGDTMAEANAVVAGDDTADNDEYDAAISVHSSDGDAASQASDSATTHTTTQPLTNPDKPVSLDLEPAEDETMAEYWARVNRMLPLPAVGVRAYVRQPLSDTIDKATLRLLEKLGEAGRRAVERGKKHRFYVLGFKQTLKMADHGRLRMLVLAPDIEPAKELDDLTSRALRMARRCQAPIVYALSRRRLAKVFAFLSPGNGVMRHVSCVGILDAGAAQQELRELALMTRRAQNTFEREAAASVKALGGVAEAARRVDADRAERADAPLSNVELAEHLWRHFELGDTCLLQESATMPDEALIRRDASLLSFVRGVLLRILNGKYELCDVNRRADLAETVRGRVDESERKKREEECVEAVMALLAPRELRVGRLAAPRRCELCDVTCLSQEVYDGHMQGARHRKNLKKAAEAAQSDESDRVQQQATAQRAQETRADRVSLGVLSRPLKLSSSEYVPALNRSEAGEASDLQRRLKLSADEYVPFAMMK